MVYHFLRKRFQRTTPAMLLMLFFVILFLAPVSAGSSLESKLAASRQAGGARHTATKPVAVPTFTSPEPAQEPLHQQEVDEQNRRGNTEIGGEISSETEEVLVDEPHATNPGAISPTLPSPSLDPVATPSQTNDAEYTIPDQLKQDLGGGVSREEAMMTKLAAARQAGGQASMLSRARFLQKEEDTELLFDWETAAKERQARDEKVASVKDKVKLQARDRHDEANSVKERILKQTSELRDKIKRDKLSKDQVKSMVQKIKEEL
mmetsp:Transcript_26207/g.36190  ORF Transcript_26207/g.36190 Transcript_26207/m.36190 type:complete len:263 (-) Transcript_26207:140-928(-)|eukprot:CAMPEP_0196592816 /NCGR_PEP_ID=MMETSP1081-20130531/73891_1 /TAXON_ID=36882 /ORGANISM="Pyramimonas amylifera, Strain CCMP720" /LENGTH=262 /DNA_ID=CAMNT_0041916621 /DNA_START=125 /DNA_END=913 /DNA_ORIENTATION=+